MPLLWTVVVFEDILSADIDTVHSKEWKILEPNLENSCIFEEA